MRRVMVWTVVCPQGSACKIRVADAHTHTHILQKHTQKHSNVLLFPHTLYSAYKSSGCGVLMRTQISEAMTFWYRNTMRRKSRSHRKVVKAGIAWAAYTRLDKMY